MENEIFSKKLKIFILFKSIFVIYYVRTKKLENIMETEERKEQIVSRDRVVEFGEVYTDIREINAMLKIIYEDMGYYKNNECGTTTPEGRNNLINFTYLDPAVGDGNFLEQILKDKLEIKNNKNIDLLKAISCLYGVDVIKDNVEKCKERLYNVIEPYMDKTDKWIEVIKFVLDKNIIWGNSLTYCDYNDPKVKGAEPNTENNEKEDRKNFNEIVFVDWNVLPNKVTYECSPISDIMENEEKENSDDFDLFADSDILEESNQEKIDKIVKTKNFDFNIIDEINNLIKE